MSEVTLFGSPRSVYVQMAGIVLTHKEVPYTFHDLETEMNTPSHIALRPFERVPILRHRDSPCNETSAIVAYVDDAFDGPNLTPADPQTRAQMNRSRHARWLPTGDNPDIESRRLARGPPRLPQSDRSIRGENDRDAGHQARVVEGQDMLAGR